MMDAVVKTTEQGATTIIGKYRLHFTFYSMFNRQYSYIVGKYKIYLYKL